MPRILLAAFAIVLPLTSSAQIEFTAYLHADSTDYFLLTDRDASARSDWLTLGKSFRGRQIVSYDDTHSTLLVDAGGKRETLPLRDTITREGGPGLQVVRTEFGWFAPKAKGRGTTDIPLELGVTFGIETVLTNVTPKATVDLETRIYTPPLTQPDGTITTVKTSRQKISASAEGKVPTRTAYFTFEQPWQLVPGTYRTELVYDGRVIASKAFNVSPNAPRPSQPEDRFLPNNRN